MIDIARPVGTDKKYQENVKTVKLMDKLKGWTNKRVEKALRIYDRILDGEIDCSPTVLKTSAKDILDMHKYFFDEIDGVAKPTIKDKKTQEKEKAQEQSEKAKKKTEENGGTPFLRLTCDDSTGTDG